MRMRRPPSGVKRFTMSELLWLRSSLPNWWGRNRSRVEIKSCHTFIFYTCWLFTKPCAEDIFSIFSWKLKMKHTHSGLSQNQAVKIRFQTKGFTFLVSSCGSAGGHCKTLADALFPLHFSLAMTLLDPFGQPPFPLSYNNVIMYGDHMVREDIHDEHISFHWVAPLHWSAWTR